MKHDSRRQPSSAPMEYFPIAIRLSGRKVVVAGGGRVAERKVRSLLGAGASVTVVAPAATPRLRKLADRGVIRWRRRRVRQADVRAVRFSIAASDDGAVNAMVSIWARKLGVLVNVVDQSRLSDFISPALARFKQALVAVYTDGKDPVLSRDLKNYLTEQWNDFISYRRRL